MAMIYAAAYNATKAARAIVAWGKKIPVLIESMTYRVGHHGTDPMTRQSTEIERRWRNTTCKITPSHVFGSIWSTGWWDQNQEKDLRKQVKDSVMKSLAKAENQQKPAIEHLFTDVYDELTPNLIEQKKKLQDLMTNYPEYYPTNDFDSSS